MKRLAHTTSLITLLWTVGCHQPSSCLRLPPTIEQQLPGDGGFEDLLIVSKEIQPDKPPHQMVRIDYETGRVMISFTYDPRRGDVLLFFPERPKERSVYLYEKNAATVLRRYIGGREENPLFLEEEKRFNAAYDAWRDSRTK